MNDVSIKKKLVIEYDVITGNMDVINEDDMSFGELLAALEYAKWLLHKDWTEKEPR